MHIKISGSTDTKLAGLRLWRFNMYIHGVYEKGGCGGLYMSKFWHQIIVFCSKIEKIRWGPIGKVLWEAGCY